MKNHYATVVAIAWLVGMACDPLLTSDAIEGHLGYFKDTGQHVERLDFDGIKFETFRDALYVPQAFGPLITITYAEAGSTFWFQDDTAQIRNVFIPAANPSVIQRKGTIDAEVEDADTKVPIQPNLGYFRKMGQQLLERLTYNGLSFDTSRDVYYIPQDFGELLTITSAGSGNIIFWFQDGEKHIRNVFIPITNPSIIQRKGTVDVESKSYLEPELTR